MTGGGHLFQAQQLWRSTLLLQSNKSLLYHNVYPIQDSSYLRSARSHIWCLNIYNLQPKIEICLCSEAMKTWRRRREMTETTKNVGTASVSANISQSYSILMREGSGLPSHWWISELGPKSAHHTKQLLTRPHWQTKDSTWDEISLCQWGDFREKYLVWSNTVDLLLDDWKQSSSKQ